MRSGLSVLPMLALTACGQPAGHTVDYYRGHREERATRMRECVNDAGTLRDSPECIDAREAARIDGVGSLKSLPPMGLPGTAEPKHSATPVARKE